MGIQISRLLGCLSSPRTSVAGSQKEEEEGEGEI